MDRTLAECAGAFPPDGPSMGRIYGLSAIVNIDNAYYINYGMIISQIFGARCPASPSLLPPSAPAIGSLLAGSGIWLLGI